MPLLNLRDVATETALRPGVLYRSAQPHTLTAEDAKLVAGLRLIADLRGDLYVGLLRHRTTWFAGVVAEIADGLPALVHCAAGKDRTGIVVALILDLLGVEHEAIVRAYALTAKALPDVMLMLEMTPSWDAPAALPEAPESAMRTFLAALGELGGAERLLLANGLTKAHADRLRAALVP
ncbi:tyrosine-protein phosphatase [Nonomuraea angiospora]|uniref:Protein-tyrosine phosphatase n=1 Tax=Nonomuraea angiospora TaxID=46172 RepID=A0ABR9MER0_9ACTN|nr:tyrosine-protein phosphatase [Nonomuraea angiospora]MBE1591284.1 protein-tyrosine phosphatase [Nonomuraea angiospora]